jgi:dTMP kinase
MTTAENHRRAATHTSKSLPGKFISFEGPEACGKTTQIERLVSSLTSLGHEVVVTREPGGSPAAEKIRSALLLGTIQPLGPIAAVMMFNAARAHHLDEVIRPALARGAIVICDRFADSTLAYQGAGDRVDGTWIKTIQAAVVGPTWPDLTLILDAPVETTFSRMSSRGNVADHFESADIGFHQRLRQGFLDIAAENPDRCAVIDATRTVEAVGKDICEKIEKLLELRS